MKERCEIGGIGSGNRNKIAEKKGVYKIFGLTDAQSDYYWFLGCSKQFLCKVKAYYQYIARKNTLPNNLLMNKIISLNYDFDIVEIEILPKDYTFKDAKLYLQKEYLDKYECKDGLLNRSKYCFCHNKPSQNPNLPIDIKQKICQLYKEGKKTKVISQQLGIPVERIIHILRINKINKMHNFRTALRRYNEGEEIEVLIKEYNLSEYHIKKIID